MNTYQPTDLEYTAQLHSDLFKDVHGFRPRGMTDGWSIDEYNKDMDRLQNQLKVVMAEEERIQAIQVRSLLNRIATLSVGPVSLESVLQFLHNQYHTDGDDEYLEWNLNVPYGTIKSIREGKVGQ